MKLTEHLSSTTGFNETTVQSVVDSFCKYVEMSLRNGEEVLLPVFGKFTVKDTPERPGRNPRTGEEITIPAKRRPNFKFSKSFVDAIQTDDVAEETPDVPPIPPELLNPIGGDPLWYVAINGTAQKLKQSELNGKVQPTTPVWSERTGWKLAKDLPELAYLF